MQHTCIIAGGRDAELERVNTTIVNYEQLDIVFQVQWADPQRVCNSCLQLQGFTLDNIQSEDFSAPADVIRGEGSNMAVIPYTQLTSPPALLYYRLVVDTESGVAHTPFLGFQGTCICSYTEQFCSHQVPSSPYFRVEWCSDQSCCSKQHSLL